MARGGFKEWDINCKVYVGNLPIDAAESEIEYVFSKYGSLKNVWVARNPPGFAFVEFEDSRDAKDAVKGLNSTKICGRRVKVEMSTGKSNVTKGSHGSNRHTSSRSRRRSRSRSPRKSRSRSNSRPRGRRFDRDITPARRSES